MAEDHTTKVLVISAYPVARKILSTVWLFGLVFLLGRDSLGLAIAASLIFFMHIESYWFTVVVREDGILVRHLIGKRFIPWQAVVGVNTIFWWTVVFRRGFLGFNFPWLVLTATMSNYRDAAAIIRNRAADLSR